MKFRPPHSDKFQLFEADSLRQEKEKVLSAVRLPHDLAAGTALTIWSWH